MGRRPPRAADQARPHVILRENWRERFERFAASLTGRALYVTVDIDGLRAEDAVTNWENGRFHAEDVAWALGELSRHARVMAGDLCGARSDAEPTRAAGQRFASETDHPDLPAFDRVARRGGSNLRSFETIWPQLTGRVLTAPFSSPTPASRPTVMSNVPMISGRPSAVPCRKKLAPSTTIEHAQPLKGKNQAQIQFLQ